MKNEKNNNYTNNENYVRDNKNYKSNKNLFIRAVKKIAQDYCCFSLFSSEKKSPEEKEKKQLLKKKIKENTELKNKNMQQINRLVNWYKNEYLKENYKSVPNILSELSSLEKEQKNKFYTECYQYIPLTVGWELNNNKELDMQERFTVDLIKKLKEIEKSQVNKRTSVLGCF